MSLTQDLQALEPGQLIQLVEVDGTAFGMDSVLRFHACNMPYTEEDIVDAANIVLGADEVQKGTFRNGTLAASDYGVIATSTKADPGYVTPAAQAIPGSKMSMIKMIARWVNQPPASDDNFQVYWATASHGMDGKYYLGGRLSAITTVRDDGWLEFTFDMSGATGVNDWLTNHITQVRFDLWQQAVGVIEITKISFINNDPNDIDVSALPPKSIWWQGNEYDPHPYEFKGAELTSTGSQPTPTLSIGNIGNYVTSLCLAYDDMVQAKVRIRTTMVKYLDAANWKTGNPSAMPTEERVQLFYINAKKAETRAQVDFELCTPFDIQNLQLPTRQITPVCTWCMRGWYRTGTGCDYNGNSYFKKDGTPTDDPAQDVCGGRRQDCEDRHGKGNPLPYGGFPAANLQGK